MVEKQHRNGGEESTCAPGGSWQQCWLGRSQGEPPEQPRRRSLAHPGLEARPATPPQRRFEGLLSDAVTAG
jgi:hypothetical protein